MMKMKEKMSSVVKKMSEMHPRTASLSKKVCNLKTVTLSFLIISLLIKVIQVAVIMTAAQKKFGEISLESLAASVPQAFGRDIMDLKTFQEQKESLQGEIQEKMQEKTTTDDVAKTVFPISHQVMTKRTRKMTNIPSLDNWEIESGFKIFFVIFTCFWILMSFLGAMGILTRVILLIIVTQVVYLIGIFQEFLLIVFMDHPTVTTHDSLLSSSKDESGMRLSRDALSGKNAIDDPASSREGIPITNHHYKKVESVTLSSSLVHEDSNLSNKSLELPSQRMPSSSTVFLSVQHTSEHTSEALEVQHSSPLSFMNVYLPLVIDLVTNILLTISCCWFIKSSEGLFVPGLDDVDQEAMETSPKVFNLNLKKIKEENVEEKKTKKNKNNMFHTGFKSSIETDEEDMVEIKSQTAIPDDMRLTTMSFPRNCLNSSGTYREFEPVDI